MVKIGEKLVKLVFFCLCVLFVFLILVTLHNI